MQMITTSEIKISALVDRDQALPALRTVHQAFELHNGPTHIEPWTSSSSPAQKATEVQTVLARLGGVDMEEMFLDGIQLDQSQGRVTLVGIPNEPGVAAKIFEQLAVSQIFVDMIVQSHPHRGTANLSFTVPSAKVPAGVDAVRRAAASLTFQTITSEAAVAKLSVSGIGLRSHTGVAIRLFQALAQANINVNMVSTSEVRINVVVNAADGQRGKAILESAFSDVLR